MKIHPYLSGYIALQGVSYGSNNPKTFSHAIGNMLTCFSNNNNFESRETNVQSV